jgi:hypothetical protein
MKIAIPIAFLLTITATAAEPGPSNQPLAWPAPTREGRPWSYWWWLGSAVDTNNLTRELQRYADSGWGGVHIIPIYGAKGWEDKYLDYLSPPWMAMLRHTVSEANRLGLGVDMTTGTGWCFGGPNVSDQDANASVVVKTFDVPAGGALTNTFDRLNLQALVAFCESIGPGTLPDGRGSARGPRRSQPTEPRPSGSVPRSEPANTSAKINQAIDLTPKLGADGKLDWRAPDEGSWRVYAVSQRPSGQKVKRAAPGGAGHMLNLIYPDAVGRYLERFSQAFANYAGPKPRAMYHDSYEYRSDWAPDFFARFEQRRGYRLQEELPALFGKEESERAARVKCDYRETISDLMAEASLPRWVQWAHGQGFITRDQAHGSPGNLLDLYAVADIPETEMFYTDRDLLVSKFASSAAHVMAKPLVAAETGTWLKEHFTETLADMKYLLDDLFLAGVNHVIYHGTCYSPDEAGWPGWLFYASYEMNPSNSIWRDVPALSAYVARCQAMLQAGRPDNDFLLYWPIYDRWHDPKGLAQNFSVHSRDWLDGQTIGQVGRRLWQRGYAFDFVSDRQLGLAKTARGQVRLPGGNYRAVVAPPCEHLPVETLKNILDMANAGATVVFGSQLPKDVPGWGDLERRRKEFQALTNGLHFSEGDSHLRQARVGAGRVIVGEVEAALAFVNVPRESLTDHAGLFCTRRASQGRRDYLVANRGEKAFDGWVRLAAQPRSVGLMDPLSGRVGMAASRPSAAGASEFRLQLGPGESLILRAFEQEKVQENPWPYWQPAGPAAAVAGTWRVEFVRGGPELPAALTTTNLASWTVLGGEAAQRFAGTARYRITFDAPAPGAAAWALDLGRVCQSARVRVNGRDVGTLIVPPFRVTTGALKPRGNLLEIEVTNVSANRIRDLDRRQAAWKTFHDINFVNINYRPFNAADWPLADSGLLGPVTLQPVVTSVAGQP